MATLRTDARTTGAAVKEVFTDTDMSADDLIPFVNAASYVVDDIEDAAHVTISDDRLRDIETWLAAHRATASDPLHESEELESWSADYLRETTFGQTAAEMDPTGHLSGGGQITVRSPDAKGIR